MGIRICSCIRICICICICSFACLLSSSGCCPPPKPRKVIKPCTPRCQREGSCAGLDARLVEARQPLLTCVGKRASKGDLAGAHRCYRSLRLLESARWWLKTLMEQDDLHAVYKPSAVVTREFLCQIEALAGAKTAVEVERIYLEMIRSYP
jgi:hypothetical protein